ncbi:girdin-like isoform X1 [Gouania willdenowi]|uniref:girdin-like isoform X1 n=1 Tax=Gouania willdenowi TaxID=441366 RepID=UPI001056387A|nr:girdin-like isoform X1 [Gouania willdenowi]
MSDMENENNAVNQSVITGTDIEHFGNEKLRDLLQSSEARHKEKDAEIEKMKAQHENIATQKCIALAFYQEKVQVFADDLLTLSKINQKVCDEANMKIQTLTEEKHKFIKLNEDYQRKMEWEKDQLFSTKTELEKMELEQKTLQKHCQSQNDQITDYKEQIDNLRKQNNSLQENLERMKLSESELSETREKEKAMLNMKIDDVQRKVVNQNDKITDYIMQNHQLKEQNNSLQKNLEIIKLSESELSEIHEKEKAMLNMEIDDVQRQVVKQNDKITDYKEQNHNLIQQNNSLQKDRERLCEIEEMLRNTQTEKAILNMEIDDVQRQVVKQNDKITDYKEQNHNLIQQNNSLQKDRERLCEIEEMLRNTQTEKAILNMEIDDVQRKVVKQNDKITDYKEQNHNLIQQNSLLKDIKRLCEIEEMFQNRQNEKAILKLKIDEVQRKVVNQNDKITDYKEQNHNLIQQNNSLQKDIKRLCEIEEMFQNTQTEKAILKLENDKVSIKVKYLCDNLVMTEQENNDLKRKLTEAIHINLILKNTITKMKHENDKLKRNVVKCSEKPVSVTTSLTEAHVGSESTPIASSEDSDSQSSKQENHKTSKFKKMKNFLKKKLLRKKDS